MKGAGTRTAAARPKVALRSVQREVRPAGPAGGAEPVPFLGEERIGLEGRVAHDDHRSLKVWLRLLSCSTQIETEIRTRLRAEFGITLARFDYLAQLHRHPAGLRMRALSRYLMVTGGNVTGLTDELAKEGLVERVSEPDDRRSSRVCLTVRGRATFEAIAAVHEAWVIDIFKGLGRAETSQLHHLLGQLRLQLAEIQNAGADASARPDAAPTLAKDAA